MSPKFSDKCSYEKRRGHREEGKVKLEAENGVLCLQAKDHQELSTTIEGRGEAGFGFFLRASRRNQP